MRSTPILVLLVVFTFFPVKSVLGQNADPWQGTGQAQPPSAPQNPALPAPIPQGPTAPPVKVSPPAPAVASAPAPPRPTQEDLKAQIDEQRATIQWLMETVKSLQSKAVAGPALLPLPTAPAADASIFPVQLSEPPSAESTQQPYAGGSSMMQQAPNTSAVDNTAPGGTQRLGGGPPFANMPDSLGFKSPNGEHEVHFTGQIQTDERVYKNTNDTTDIDEFLLRRARLGVEGVVFNNYEFRILPDFGQGKVVMQDCLANVHYVDWFQVMGGKFKEPVSFEEAFVQDRFVPTVERSIIDQITPARDIGFMLYGRGLLGDQVDWYAGVFNGEINGDTATTKSKNYAGRVAWRPLNYDVIPEWLSPVQVGVSGTVGAESEALSLTGVGNETLRTSSQVPWLTFLATDKADGTRTRLVPELTYFYGPVGLCAEFIRMDQAISAGTAGALPHDVRFEGYMVTTTYMLTGEYHKAWGYFAPTNAFDPAHPFTNPGAWELTASISRLHVDSAIFDKGSAIELASPTGQSDGCTEYTVGFNWYLNGYVKVQFNWEHAIFDQAVTLNTASNISFRISNALLTRLQLAF